jgi:hypothetical protein
VKNLPPFITLLFGKAIEPMDLKWIWAKKM